MNAKLLAILGKHSELAIELWEEAYGAELIKLNEFPMVTTLWRVWAIAWRNDQQDALTALGEGTKFYDDALLLQRKIAQLTTFLHDLMILD